MNPTGYHPQRVRRSRILLKSALGCFFIALMGMSSSLRLLAAEPVSEIAGSQILNPDDGWLDLSSFLERPFGFVPLVNGSVLMID